VVKRPAVICRGNANGVPAALAEAVGGELIVATGDNVVPALLSAFRDGRPIVTNLAAPIVIRALAPLLGGKFNDPPVVATSYDAKFIVPLLGLSHGARKLAHTISEKLSKTLVTFGGTATHFAAGNALDDAPDGYLLSNHEDYKDFAVAVLDGEPVKVEGDAPWLASLPQAPDARKLISVTEKDLPGTADHLVYISETLAVGIGCERGTTKQEIEELVEQVLRDNNLHLSAIACFATIDIKEDEAGMQSLFSLYGRLRLFSADELAAQSSRIKTPSEVVRAEIGVASVAEAAALAAAGPDSELIVAKTKSKRVTCAVAKAPLPIIKKLGRQPGSLSVVGIGPGNNEMRSLSASSALWNATDWVGYGLYLDLIADKKSHQTEHRFPLCGEEDRVRHAIALAKEGKQVALVCSGDAGIYAMAALVYEIVDLEPNRIAVEVIPGISAFQAAAAKAGAMIGHDFCCISLSDLLTPWEVIERRVKAAAEGDFVISFYNPRSLKRRDQLERAFAILKDHRPPDTPVIVASNLGRPEEKVTIVPFSAFNPDDVDMLTLVMVGSSQSKSFTRGDGKTCAYTPRGYAKKRDQQ
jgi:cobalt-precorrin 5A hydrolase / precorrin-3B C17-methyltransferase